MRHKTLLIFFLIWPIFSVWLSFAFTLNAFESILLFFCVPAIILSVFQPRNIKKALIASLILLPLSVIGDYIAETTHAWIWPLPHSVFPFLLFSYVAIESVIWLTVQTYTTIMFFQFFSEKVLVKKSINKRSKTIIISTLLLLVLFLLTFYFFPSLLNIPYWYFIIGAFFMSPIVVFEDLKYPKVFHRMIKTGVYFFYLNFSYEITALKLHWWSFPSKQYIGYISLLGVTFPLEEFIFWIIISTFTVLSYYEYFYNAER